MSVQVGLGLPSIIRSYLKIKTSGYETSVKGYGPYILKLNYRLNNRFSIGINSMFNYTKISWDKEGYGPAPYFEKQKYKVGIIGNEFSITARTNYYFWQKNRTDFYGGIGLGYGYTNAKSFSEGVSQPFIADIDFPSPIRFDATLGFRYFPTKHVGIYSEVGLGKTWILLKQYFIPEALFQIGVVIN